MTNSSRPNLSDPSFPPPAPVPDMSQDNEETTSPHHEIPSFVGEPPKNIPQAPIWARALIANSNETNKRLGRLLRNQDLQLKQQSAFQKEMLARADRHEAILELHAARLDDIESDLRLAERDAETEPPPEPD